VVGFVAVFTAATALYGPVLARLWSQWLADENYSHGVLIVPIAALLAWRQRERLRNTPRNPSPSGLVLVLGSLALLVAGSLAAELFTTRVSLLGVLAGAVVFVYGWRHLRAIAFPIAFLLFMIPLPTLLVDPATQSLQLVASGLGERLLRAADIPVLRDGNILTLPTITLNVTDACSGIRSLMSLLAVTTLVAYLDDLSMMWRVVLTATAVPLAITLNGLRVAFTGIAASRISPAMARGFVHEASGWAIFVVAFLCIWLFDRAIRGTRALPQRLAGTA
jgi:exosortase